jgi:hypothetical protein
MSTLAEWLIPMLVNKCLKGSQLILTEMVPTFPAYLEAWWRLPEKKGK